MPSVPMVMPSECDYTRELGAEEFRGELPLAVHEV